MEKMTIFNFHINKMGMQSSVICFLFTRGYSHGLMQGFLGEIKVRAGCRCGTPVRAVLSGKEIPSRLWEVFEMEKNIINLRHRDEIEIITPLLSNLPEDEKAYFLKIFGSDGEVRDAFFEKLFNQFDKLRVTKTNFMAKEKECR